MSSPAKPPFYAVAVAIQRCFNNLYLVFWVAYPYQIDYLDSGIESKNYRAKTFSTNGKWNDRFHFHQLRIASTDLWGAPLILSELTVQFFRTVENAENSPVKTDHFD